MDIGSKENTVLAAEATSAEEPIAPENSQNEIEDYRHYSYDMFIYSTKKQPDEVERLSRYLDAVDKDRKYTFEALHPHMQTTETIIERNTGEKLPIVNLASYNYLGYSCHPEVIQAAKDALDQFGLGAACTPIISGTFTLHKRLEDLLIEFFDLPNHGASLFTSGYGVNTGTISAFMKPGTHVILDRAAHMSLIEGAQLSRAKIHYFEHNNMEHLEEILKKVSEGNKRILICTEGVYSVDGDMGNIKAIVKLAKQYGAFTLVDEAHSSLLAGKHGRGVCEEHGVLKDVDFYVMTFSKAFGGVGGAVLARKDISRYINFYARCHMFSCALDPAVTGGIIKALELSATEEGAKRRERIKENAEYMRNLLKGKVDVLNSNSWIIPVIYGDEKLTFPINDYLQRHGVDAGFMAFPAAPRNEARIRLFVTSEHTKEQLKKAAGILLETAEKFGFLL